jgi:hypothetical protein
MKFLPRARQIALAGALLTALGVAGCANASPGVAAYVGDEQITQQQLDDVSKQVDAALKRETPVGAVLQAMIQGELVAQVARSQNIVITDADRDAVVASSDFGTLASTPGGKSLAYDLADISIVQTKMAPEALKAELAKRTVTLNPRYGVFDQATTQIVGGRSGSLSTAPPAAAQ